MEPSDCLYLSPLDIYYSQDTIAATFHDGQKIGHTLDALVNMDIFVTDIPPITVVHHGDKFFSRNNRRLWVFKQLKKMGRCEYIPTILASELPSEQFTTEIGGHEIIVRGDHASNELTGFHDRTRQSTLDNILMQTNGPLMNSCSLKFSPRFKPPNPKNKSSAKKRKMLRAKRRKQKLLFPKSESEATGFDFAQYAEMAQPSVAFSGETQVVFKGTLYEYPKQPSNMMEIDVNNNKKFDQNGGNPVQGRGRLRSWHAKFD